MRKCNCCKKEQEEQFFIKKDGSFFILCNRCREKGKIANNLRKEAKSAQSKEYYENYKNEISERNKKYRNANKEKLKAYDKSPKRRAANKEWTHKKRREDPCRFIYYSAKKRSKNNKLNFNIDQEYIKSIYPKDNKCPILGIDLFINNSRSSDNSPTLDRVIPEIGYVKDNVIIISYRANRIKNDASLEEIEKIFLFLKNRSIK